jgi:hypothetical protein
MDCGLQLATRRYARVWLSSRGSSSCVKLFRIGAPRLSPTIESIAVMGSANRYGALALEVLGPAQAADHRNISMICRNPICPLNAGSEIVRMSPNPPTAQASARAAFPEMLIVLEALACKRTITSRCTARTGQLHASFCRPEISIRYFSAV